MMTPTRPSRPTTPKANRWSLHHDLIEIYWKRGPGGLFADRVRIKGATFWYISGKKRKVKL